jgi:hypothetical protein
VGNGSALPRPGRAVRDGGVGGCRATCPQGEGDRRVRHGRGTSHAVSIAPPGQGAATGDSRVPCQAA